MIENNDALLQDDSLKTGYGPLFMIREPAFVDNEIPDKDSEKLVEVATEEATSEEELTEDEGESIPPQIGRFTAHGLGYKRPVNATKKRRKKNKIAKASRRRNQKNH